MTFEIFLDILIIALLSVGIVYAVILEHRLSTTRENKRELSRLMEQFYQATQKTAQEFAHLKQMENEAREILKEDMERAALMRDELVFLMNKIQKNYTSSVKVDVAEERQKNLLPRSQAEQDLINALNAMK